MKRSWVPTGADKALAKEIELSYKSAGLTRSRLAEMLEAKIRLSEKEGRSKEGYDCPNWAYKQADLAGYTRALQDVISLIK